MVSIPHGDTTPPLFLDHRHSILLAWSEEDQAFIVRVPELPGCITHGATYEEAVTRGHEAIAGFVEALRAWGDPVPPPRTYAEYAATASSA
jgi:predicted RNase H-like HicB family nuclease